MRDHRMLFKALAALLLLLASCADFDLYGVMQGKITGGTLQISPVAVTLIVGATCTFSAQGGVPPYSFSVVLGSGSIDPESGLYAAPDIPDSEVIQVQDSQGAISQAVATVLY